MKRLIATLLCLCALLTLCSCAGGSASDEELLAAARLLLPGAQIVNHVLFEEDIPALPLGAEMGDYAEADPDFLRPWELSTLADIRRFCETVFTAETVEQIFRMGVEARYSETGLLSAAYLLDSDGRLMVSRAGRSLCCDPTVFDLDSLRVVSKAKDTAVLSVTATVTDNETGATQSRTKRLNLRRVGDTWYLDSVTCMTYNGVFQTN